MATITIDLKGEAVRNLKTGDNFEIDCVMAWTTETFADLLTKSITIKKLGTDNKWAAVLATKLENYFDDEVSTNGQLRYTGTHTVDEQAKTIRLLLKIKDAQVQDSGKYDCSNPDQRKEMVVRVAPQVDRIYWKIGETLYNKSNEEQTADITLQSAEIDLQIVAIAEVVQGGTESTMPQMTYSLGGVPLVGFTPGGSPVTVSEEGELSALRRVRRRFEWRKTLSITAERSDQVLLAHQRLDNSTDAESVKKALVRFNLQHLPTRVESGCASIQHGQVGQKLTIECLIRSNPAMDNSKVTWRLPKTGQEILLSSSIDGYNVEIQTVNQTETLRKCILSINSLKEDQLDENFVLIGLTNALGTAQNIVVKIKKGEPGTTGTGDGASALSTTVSLILTSALLTRWFW